MSQKLSKRKLAQLYRQTAKAFEDGEFNWDKGGMGSMGLGKATHCAVSGLTHTAYKLGLIKEYSPWDSEELGIRDKVTERKVSNALGAGHVGAIGFNDDYASTKEDVIKYLRKVARALEHGGKL